MHFVRFYFGKNLIVLYDCLSRQIQPDWGITTQADKAGLGSIGLRNCASEKKITDICWMVLNVCLKESVALDLLKLDIWRTQCIECAPVAQQDLS